MLGLEVMPIYTFFLLCAIVVLLFWATQSDGFRLRFCLQDQKHPTADFSCFLFDRPGPLSSRCQPIHHWWHQKNSPGSLTWLSGALDESTSGPVSSDWQVFFPCESSANQRRFFIIQTVAEVSLKVFFLQKKPCHSAAILRAKSPCEIFRGKNLKRTRSMAIFCSTP